MPVAALIVVRPRIEVKAIKSYSLGADGDRVRGTLEREFAAFLEARAPARKQADIVGLAGSLVGNVLRPASVRAGREFAALLFAPDGPSFAEGFRRARSRMDTTVRDATAPDAAVKDTTVKDTTVKDATGKGDLPAS